MIKLLSTCLAFLISLSLFAQVETETSLIAFGLDEDHLSAFAKTQLAEIAEEAKSADVYRLELFGHTDQQGNNEYNVALAERRALNVAQVLAELGLQENKIQVKSFGESQLLEKENSEVAFAKNRRVELVLYKEMIRSEERLYEILAASRTYRETVKHDQENQLEGKEGVQISVPANAFVFADGSPLPAGANVEVVLEEATRPSSMMAHQLSTNGKGGRLSTGGMVRVTGKYQGETLHLASGKAIDVSIPTQEFDSEMRLYVGERRDDAGMDWDLDAGESVNESTRIEDGKLKKKRKLAPDEIEIVEEMKALIAKRNSFLAKMNTERLEAYEPPTFPNFKALPKEFDPLAGIPKKPFIPAAPQRTISNKGLFAKGPSQRKLDEAYLADSIAYAKELPTRQAKLEAFAEQLGRFEAETPTRERAHQAKIDKVVDYRVGQAQEYLLEQYAYASARTVLNWKEKVENTGPDGKQKKSSIRKMLSESLVGFRGHADADVVIAKALGPQLSDERISLDTVGFDFKSFEENFLIEKGLNAPMVSVKQIQKRIQTLFSVLRSKQYQRANNKPDKFNDKFASSYSFQIRTPRPMWHNCDHPLPEGLYQMMVSLPVPVRTYMYAGHEKSLDYFPPGRRASVVYQKPVTLDILSFGIVDKRLQLATKITQASRSQTDIVELEYNASTLSEIETAMVALDDTSES